jgi:hypothetical protein
MSFDIKPDHDYDFREQSKRTNGKEGESIAVTLTEEDKDKPMAVSGDRAINEFSRGTIRAETNQLGTQGRKFSLEPTLASISSAFANSQKLVEAKHKVQDFWVYDGAYPGLTDRGSISTSRDQILPDKRITEQDAMEWQRIGSKKGWMYEGRPQEEYGSQGENIPTHTDDGFISSISKHKWKPTPRSGENQGLAMHEMPAIDIENNARGIGTTGAGSGSGGMAGGYREVNPERLKRLPIPMAKFNWTGSRLAGTGREDQALGAGAGGFRSGYTSQYTDRPAYMQYRTAGLNRLTKSIT